VHRNYREQMEYNSQRNHVTRLLGLAVAEADSLYIIE
jgi:hypothetical protein